MIWVDYLTIMSLLLVALTSPGPSVIAIVGLSMSQGRRQALLFAMGVALGTLTLATFASLGFSQLIARYIWLFWSFKIIGTGYLILLGYRALRSAAASQDMLFNDLSVNLGSGWKLLIAGLGVHLTNPKAIFAWAAIISTSTVQSPPIWYYALLLGSAFALSMTINGGYAVLLSIRPVQIIYAKARRGLQACFGSLFVLAGLRVLTARAP